MKVSNEAFDSPQRQEIPHLVPSWFDHSIRTRNILKLLEHVSKQIDSRVATIDFLYVDEVQDLLITDTRCTCVNVHSDSVLIHMFSTSRFVSEPTWSFLGRRHSPDHLLG